MKIIRKRNFSKLAVARLNINSKRNKFKALIQNVSGELDLLMFSETKIDESFLESKFLIKGFSDPFCRDRNFHGGSILLYVRDNTPTKILSTEPIPS